MIAIKRVEFRYGVSPRYAVYDCVAEEYTNMREDGTFSKFYGDAGYDAIRISDCLPTLAEAREAMMAYKSYIAKYWQKHDELEDKWACNPYDPSKNI